MMRNASEVIADLREIETYFEERADAEYFTDSPAPVGNEEMRLLGIVREAIATLPAAEPADAGRDAVAVARVIHSADALTRMELLPDGLLLGYGTHDLYACPQSEAAAACAWAQEDDEGGCWVTGCGHRFELNDGGPSDNGMKHCCYCGKPLIEHPWSDEDEDELAGQHPQAGGAS